MHLLFVAHRSICTLKAKQLSSPVCQVVLDNSPGRDAARDAFLPAAGVEVVATRTPLAFAQLQNAVRALALDRALDFYFWGHADIVLVGPAQARGPVCQHRPCMIVGALPQL